MRYLFLLLLFCQCQAQPGAKRFRINDTSWSISVPSEFVADDSVAFYKRFGKTSSNSVTNQARVILYIHDTSGWNLSRHTLMATLAPTPVGTSFNSYISKQQTDHLDMFANQSIPQKILDSSFLNTHISNQAFKEEQYVILRGNNKEHFRYYHAAINNQILTISIQYSDNDSTGRKLVPVFLNSRFAR